MYAISVMLPVISMISPCSPVTRPAHFLPHKKVRDNRDAPDAILCVAAETVGKGDMPRAAFLMENWEAVAACGIACSVGRERFEMADREDTAPPEKGPLDPVLVSAGLGQLPAPAPRTACIETGTKCDVKLESGKTLGLVIKGKTIKIVPPTGKRTAPKHANDPLGGGIDLEANFPEPRATQTAALPHSAPPVL